jgi:hypothetical protein
MIRVLSIDGRTLRHALGVFFVLITRLHFDVDSRHAVTTCRRANEVIDTPQNFGKGFDLIRIVKAVCVAVNVSFGLSSGKSD